MNKPADEPAFPTEPNTRPGVYVHHGLTKREYFAAMAMQGDLANGSWTERSPLWVEFADALIAELAKAEPEDVAAPDDGWIEHDGGAEYPMDGDTHVEVERRNGDLHRGYASNFVWANFNSNNPLDIIAYRIVKGGEA